MTLPHTACAPASATPAAPAPAASATTTTLAYRRRPCRADPFIVTDIDLIGTDALPPMRCADNTSATNLGAP